MKILSVVFSKTFDDDVCKPEFVLLDLSDTGVINELRRCKLAAQALKDAEEGDNNRKDFPFLWIIAEDVHHIATFFNDSERRVVGPYLTDPSEEFLGRPFLGESDVYVIDADVIPPDTADGDDPLNGDDGSISRIYHRELCVAPHGFYVQYELRNTRVILQSQLVPWSIVEEYEKSLLVK